MNRHAHLSSEGPSRPGDSCVMVIFGATGNLTQLKLLPALYNLARAKLLSPKFALIGTSFEPQDEGLFRERMVKAVKNYADQELDEGEFDQETLDWIAERIYFIAGDVRDPEFYAGLKARCAEVRKIHEIEDNHFYYLATLPSLFGEIIRQLGEAGMASEEGGHWRRVIIEKPFGYDLASAQELNTDIKKVLRERQIYRIDHYLGKETVQNILVMRFANSIFEPVWNRRYIDHVQITAAESVGVGQRGPYYEDAGAVRDMVPHHLFQLLSLTTMEPPVSFGADAVRDEQAKVLRAVQIPSPEDVLSKMARGQYGEGEVAGETVPGYRQEAHVAPESRTETFVAMKLMIDNWRWADVPFYLRTGKRMSARSTEIVIQFRRAPLVLFRNTAIEQLTTNRLVIHIQPKEGISLQFGAKVPGPVMKLGAVKMDFDYSDYFGSTPDTGYERLLLDCMIGDATLFQRADMVEAGWSIIQPALDVWKALPPRSFPNYAAGSWGPEEADELLERDGRHWINLT
ncbi:MAG: glucose-6-phosphate dehydrogenase [Gammaproteobacteria bacterium]|nr:glucose-6-phosphate dehydrogenase [Gammaproteobacteria bacterium]NBT44402.1 glucose-6-phosphate dehydrogenase [Gammaproteobacteria bacterium]NBY23217.1 glucose-6-phosphate dehydrogenase [Gammaproteobacteria bacterium]